MFAGRVETTVFQAEPSQGGRGAGGDTPSACRCSNSLHLARVAGNVGAIYTTSVFFSRMPIHTQLF